MLLIKRILNLNVGKVKNDMARILGIDIPDRKRSEVALTYIYGIGRNLANTILEKAGIDKNKKVSEWTDSEYNQIRDIINENYRVEGVLRSDVMSSIKRLMDIGCYRGVRHRVGMPVRGQRTKNNTRTRKGKRKTVANKKKATK